VLHQPRIDAHLMEFMVAGQVADLASHLKIVQTDGAGDVLVLTKILLDNVLHGQRDNHLVFYSNRVRQCSNTDVVWW